MPDYRRANVPGGTYFFTVNTYRRQTFLTGADVRTALREAIGTVRQTHPFRIDACVLLPDHLHALWTLPPDDHDFSHRWRVIKRLVDASLPPCPGRFEEASMKKSLLVAAISCAALAANAAMAEEESVEFPAMGAIETTPKRLSDSALDKMVGGLSLQIGSDVVSGLIAAVNVGVQDINVLISAGEAIGQGGGP